MEDDDDDPLKKSRARARRYEFRVDSLRLHGIKALVAPLASNPPLWVFRLLRNHLPIVGVPYPLFSRRWLLVTRDEDVREVLSRDDVFTVPWGNDVRRLNDGVDKGGTPFILGLDTRDPVEARLYYQGQRDVMRSFRRDDIDRLVVPRCAHVAQGIVRAMKGDSLDAVRDLFVEVFIDSCEHYFGVRMPVAREERTAFYQWSVAVSGLLFGPPFERDKALRTAEAGADRLALWVDEAIVRTIHDARAGKTPADNVLVRLAKRHVTDPLDMPWLTMRAIMMGMITGSVPTNAIAAGHILEILLERPGAMNQSRAAALYGDDAQLTRCLFEAMRYKPLNPGPWRYCSADSYTLARGTSRERRIRKGTYLLASTQSAMFDPRSVDDPVAYKPSRDPAELLLFGHALHWCVGKYIAQAQVTQAFKAMLLHGQVRRAAGPRGKMKLLGLFPEHLFVEIDTGRMQEA